MSRDLPTHIEACGCSGCYASGIAEHFEAVGAAIAFGIMGMAHAIRAVHWHAIEACYVCGRGSRGRAWEIDVPQWRAKWTCLECARNRPPQAKKEEE